MKLARIVGLAALAGAMALSGLASWKGDVAHGYRYRQRSGYHQTNYKASCKRSNCGRARTCQACAARDRTQAMTGCKGALKAAKSLCTGSDRACRSQAKGIFTQCRSSVSSQFNDDRNACRHGGQQCNTCCNRNGGQNDCSGYFRDSRFAGSYLRKYGGKRTLVCGYGGSGPPPGCPPARKGKGGCPSTSSTTSSTTSTTLRRGSAAGAFLSQPVAVEVWCGLRGLAAHFPPLAGR